MASVASLMQALNEWAPFDTQLDYDNAGLLVGNPHQSCQTVLLALDLTEDVVQEAVDKQADVILTHHPLIFPKIKAIRTDNAQGRIIQMLLKNDIAYIAAHTNLDAAVGGVSFFSARLLGLHKLQILQKHEASSTRYNREIGFGVLGEFEQPLDVNIFMKKLEVAFGCPAIRYSGNRQNPIQSVALCGGTAVSLVGEALAKNADVYVTADIKYHEYFHEQDDFLLIDIGHFESEMAVIEGFKSYLSSKLNKVNFIATEHSTNPMRVYSSKASQSLT